MRVPEAWNVKKMVWIPHKDKFLPLPTHLWTSMVSLVMSSINLSIDAYLESTSADIFSALACGFNSERYCSCGINFLCGCCRSESSQELLKRSSFTRSIYESLIVAYYTGTHIVPNGSHKQSSGIFTTMTMQVNTKPK